MSYPKREEWIHREGFKHGQWLTPANGAGSNLTFLGARKSTSRVANEHKTSFIETLSF